MFTGKKRAHITSILSSTVRTFVVVGGIVLFQMTDEIMTGEGSAASQWLTFLLKPWVLLGLLCTLLVVLVFQTVRWYNSYLEIDGDMLIQYKGLLFRKRTAVPLDRITSANLSSNVFQMLVHTSRVKFDTGSVTASSEKHAEIDMIFKKSEAEAIREYFSVQTRQVKGNTAAPSAQTDGLPIQQIGYTGIAVVWSNRKCHWNDGYTADAGGRFSCVFWTSGIFDGFRME